jgi:hypothetical protein
MTEKSAALTPVVSNLRVFPHPGGKYGDVYEWCCTVQHRGDVAWIQAIDRVATPSIWRAIVLTLREAGFRVMRWERRRPDGTEALHEFDLRPRGRRVPAPEEDGRVEQKAA